MNRMRLRIGTLFIVLILSLSIAPASLALEVNRTELPNSLLVLHSERHNLPIVMVTLLIKAGQMEEPREGLASLTARLLSEGTKTRTSARLSEEIEFIGASLGASAGADYSTITLSVLKKDVAKGFTLMSDILLNPTFPPEEITRQKELIKGSLRHSEEDPSYIAGREFAKALYGEHPYGRLHSGTIEAVDAIQRDDIAGFYKDYYVPGNSVMSVVGDITAEELSGLIATYLGGWRSLTSPKTPIAITPPKPSAKIIKVDKDLTQANIIMGHLGVKRDDPDYYALSVMNYIFGGGGFSSRLMASVRDEKGLAYGINSSFTPAKEPGVFSVGVETKNASANAVIEEILRQIKALQESGVTDKELDDAKAFLIGSFPRRIATMRSIADFLSQVEFYGLGADYIERYPKLINAVTKEDILRVARRHLHPENLTLVVVAKQKEADVKDPFEKK